jgi:nitrite reductase/ring-hydroxylating ferredoxin subunit
MAEFAKVANLTDLPAGRAMAVEVNGKAIALYNVGGTVYATDNTCLHHGGPLGEGMLEGDVITCPWHMWEYDVRTGEKVGEPALKVASYPVQVEGSDIKVAL